MEISEQHIRDLMEVYRRAYKIELTQDEARQMLQRLILMFEGLSRARRRRDDARGSSHAGNT